YTRFKTNQPAGIYEANTTAEKQLSQADLATSRNGVPAGKIDSAAGVSYGPTETYTPVVKSSHTNAPSLPPGHSLGSSVHSTRYPSPSDLAIPCSHLQKWRTYTTILTLTFSP
ncbi:hypothetical protein Tco_0380823, partial [Tanacetum coccineum]